MMRHLLPGSFCLLLLACKPPADTQEQRAKSLSFCDSGVCLVVAAADVDSDGDGVTDADEQAAGSDPNDAASRPPMRRLIDLAGKGELPSFARHHSEIFVLPVLAPNGRAVVNADPLASGPPVPARDALASLGIKAETLARFGVDAEPALQIGIAAPAAAGDDGPPVRVGGINMAWLAQGYVHLGKYEGTDMDRKPEPGGTGGGPADGGTGGGPAGGGPADGGTGGGPAGGGGAGGTGGGSEPGWFCRNLGWFCGRSDDDPAGNSIAVVDITAADMARVKAKLGSQTRPGPATTGPEVPTEPEVDDPLAPIAIYDPEQRDQGMVIIRTPGTAPNPQWNSNFGPPLVDQILGQPGTPPRGGGTGCPTGQPC